MTTEAPRVEALIEKVMARYKGHGSLALARYYEAVHQELAPLARELERENVEMHYALGGVLQFHQEGESGRGCALQRPNSGGRAACGEGSLWNEGLAMTPRRVQLSRKKGWKMPANTVKVDRTTKWGNPFIVGEHGTRADCARLFKLMLSGLICCSTGNGDAQMSYMKMARRDREQLRGKNLACWCPPDAPCHADVLLVMANE